MLFRSLAGDNQLNLSPSQPRNMTSVPPPLKFTVFSIWSTVNKAASFHSFINDFDLDIIALIETWITCDVPSAIMNDVAPASYNTLHIHRALVPGGSTCGCCLAIIHRNTSSGPGSPFRVYVATVYAQEKDRLNHGPGTSTVVTIPKFLIELGDFLVTRISSLTD